MLQSYKDKSKKYNHISNVAFQKMSGFCDGNEGGGPRCRHGTGARRKLKGFIVKEMKITKPQN